MMAASDLTVRSDSLQNDAVRGDSLRNDPARTGVRQPGLLVRWWRRRRATQRRIDHAVWDLRERFGQAAYWIAYSSSLQPAGRGERRFWRKVALRLQHLK